jgi:cytochrome c biogenesis protein CcdA
MPRARRFTFAALAIAVGAVVWLLAFPAKHESLAAQPDPFDEAYRAEQNVAVRGKARNGVEEPAPIKQLTDYLALKASVSPVQAKRGQVVQIVLSGQTKPYAYTYSAIKKGRDQAGKPTQIGYKNTPWIKPLYPIFESESKLKTTPGVDTAVVLKGDFEWKQDVFISPEASPGRHTVPVDVNIQVCTIEDAAAGTSNVCLPQEPYRSLEVTIDISGDPAVPPPADLDERLKPVPLEIITDVAAEELGGLLVGAFIGAILMLLTPCVFPMIPITVNFFIKQAEKEHHRPFAMASVYAGTIVLLLTAVITLAGKSIIDLANEPWFNLGLGVVLLLFALGLFGFFEVDLTKFFGTVLLLGVAFGLSILAKWAIPFFTQGNKELLLAILSIGAAVPLTMLVGKLLRGVERLMGLEESALLQFFARQESKGGMLGAAFMAMTFTVTSFSCTGPFLGILLAPLAGSRFTPIHLLLAALVYAVTFAAPFFFLALFPTYLKKLPKSGGWMTTIKVTMGFLEIGAALKFLANVDLFWFPGEPRIFNYDTVLCSWIALSIACSLYLFGFYRLDHDTGEDHIGVPRMIFASLFLGMGLYLTPLLFGGTPQGFVMEGAVSFLPPSLRKHGEIPWIEDDYKAAWEEAVRQKKLIFIDFTGQNCANCRANERNAFMKPKIVRELKNFVCLQLYTDRVPDPELTPDQSKREGLKQQAWQTGLVNNIANPVYVVFKPDPTSPFDETGKPKGQVVAQFQGLITKMREFALLLESARGAN